MVISTYVLFVCQMFIMHLCGCVCLFACLVGGGGGLLLFVCLFVVVFVLFFAFLHLYSSAQLSMSNMEKCYRYKSL